MSINMESSGREYADHEVQVLKMRGDPDIGADNSIDILHQTTPVSPRGIDSDELAELVAMRRWFNVKSFGEQDATQTEPGSVTVEADLGANLSPQELATRTTDGGTDVVAESQVINDQDTGSLIFGNYNEPGLFDSFSADATAGFNEIGDGTGGPGSGSRNEERFINFADEFGSGPYMDRTDDLSVHVEVSSLNAANDVEAEVYYTLYWNVQEMPEGRASFARP